MKRCFKKFFAVVLSAAMLLSLGHVSLQYRVNAAERKAAEQTVKGYRAMIGFQTSRYDCRDGYNYKDDTAGLNQLYNTWAKENGREVTDEYNGYNIYLNGSVPKYYNNDHSKLSAPGLVNVCRGAVVQDTCMSADGEYTVAIRNLYLQKGNTVRDYFNIKNYFSMLYVSTDIPFLKENDPNSGTSVQAVSVKINGQEMAGDTVNLPVKADAYDTTQTYYFMFADGYAPEDGTKNVKYQGSPSHTDGATDLVAPNESFDIEITFRISGVDWEKAPVLSQEGQEQNPMQSGKPVNSPGPSAGAKVETTTPPKNTTTKEPASKTRYDNSSKNPASSVKNQKISGGKKTLYVGNRKKLSISHGKYKVTWKSSKRSVAFVNKRGIVTAKKVGKTKITATCKGKKKVWQIQVKKKPREPKNRGYKKLRNYIQTYGDFNSNYQRMIEYTADTTNAEGEISGAVVCKKNFLHFIFSYNTTVSGHDVQAVAEIKLKKDTINKVKIHVIMADDTDNSVNKKASIDMRTYKRSSKLYFTSKKEDNNVCNAATELSFNAWQRLLKKNGFSMKQLGFKSYK